jgi:hypothetical protein
MRFVAKLSLGFILVGSTLGTLTSAAYGQPSHQQGGHQHGNHPHGNHPHGNQGGAHRNVPHVHDHAGHMVDRFGHHIDRHGRHTGAIGFYDNGIASFHAPHLSGPFYQSTVYSGLGHSGFGYANYGYYPNGYWGYAGAYPYSHWGFNGYNGGLVTSGLATSGLGLTVTLPAVSPSIVVIPQSRLNNSVIAAIPRTAVVGGGASLLDDAVAKNKLPEPDGVRRAAKAVPSSGKIVLRNPRTTEGSLHYVLNEFSYTIKPGESQTIEADRDWVIQFDNGLGKTFALKLQPGEYRFSVSQESGWGLTETEPLK